MKMLTKLIFMPVGPILPLALAAVLLTACSGGPDPSTGYGRQVGQPYSVNGVTYVPRA